MYAKWSESALASEWWEVIARDVSAIRDKIALAEYWRLPVGSYGETNLPIQETINEQDFSKMRLMEEMLSRGFPSVDHHPYIAVNDFRVYKQWCLWTAYAIGFETAIRLIKERDVQK